MSTPMRKQYLQIKKQYPDAILFFRLGDFYETFDEDAKIVAEVCDVALTSRPVSKGQRVPLAGVPWHAAEGYIAKLIRAGYKVAVCEQVGEVGKGLVEREVVRVITPGTLLEPALLDERRNNYIAALIFEGGKRAGVAYADVTTGEFAVTEIRGEEVARRAREELARLAPAELLIPDAGGYPGLEEYRITPYEPWRFETEAARQALLDYYDVASLEGFGCEGKPLAISAAGALIAYLRETQKQALGHLQPLHTYSTEDYMLLDPATRRSLELVETMREGAQRGSLLWVLDRTLTPMGGRLLRKWVNQPLLDIDRINQRLDAVEAWVNAPLERAELREALRPVRDIERWANRCTQGIVTPRDLVGLRESLRALPQVKAIAARVGQDGGLDLNEEALHLLETAIADDPPATLAHGGVIRPGFNAELDSITLAAKDARAYIAGLEAKERQRTGIQKLKVGYNKVFGYYLEIPKSQTDKAPAHYIRKQTLVNAERYITPELKEYESLILNAQERLLDLESSLFKSVVQQLAELAPRLLAAADAIARLDVFAALADVAADRRYVRPELTPDRVLDIRAGRHPVVELTLEGAAFTPNDAHMTPEQAIIILTGPNMGGKCVTGDTLTLTEQGLHPIAHFATPNQPDDTFHPLVITLDGPHGPVETSHVYSGGEQATIRIRTRTGFELEGTPEHRIWVRSADGKEGWRRLDELREDDYVAIRYGSELWGTQTRLSTPQIELDRRAKRYSLPTELNPDLAYLFGLLVGDGTLTYRESFLLSAGDPWIAREFTRIMQEQFGYTPGVKSNGKDHVVSSIQIRAFLAANGLGYHPSWQKTVPEAILQAPRELVIAFLQGLFDTDGTAENRYGNIRLSLSSKALVRQVRMLLLNLGILASIQEKPTQRRMSYRLGVNGEHAIRFHQRVGFRLPRKAKRAELASDLRMPNVGGIPHLERTLKTIQQRIVAKTDKPVALKRVKSINSIFYTYIPQGRNISYRKLDELIDYCHQNDIPCPELEEIRANHYFYDPIVEKRPSRARVYDFSVPQGHAFIAEGFISHNSTWLRQTALITLMAQIGSFVPADAARIGLVDRIFTRIGAQDEIHSGQSTFMVEMVETANILNHATDRSLLILDELGRGTSTYDGMAIAWAVLEYIHSHPKLGSRTLFATHYHELTALADRLPKIVNFHVAVAEHGDQVVFLHEVRPGRADKSYGIHVAQLAGLPKQVVARANEIMRQLEEAGREHEALDVGEGAMQLALFSEGPDPIREEIEKVDINTMTPLEALNFLYALQQKAKRL